MIMLIEIKAIMENGYVSTYWYDADGERTVKEHGADIGHYVNSAGVDSLTSAEQFTLYVNPYVVVSNDYKYTNHIGEIYRGKDYLRYKELNNTRAWRLFP